MNVFIIESSYPKDFYRHKLDGIAAQGLLNILGVSNQLRFALDLEYFEKGIAEAKALDCTVIHLSCHGAHDGIALADDYQPTWNEFANLFQTNKWCPKALVMSSCCGATSGIRNAFQNKPRRPTIEWPRFDAEKLWGNLELLVNSNKLTNVPFGLPVTRTGGLLQQDAGCVSRQEQLEADLADAWSRDPLVLLQSGVHQRYTERSSAATHSSSIRKTGARGGSRTHMRKNPRRILSPQRLPFRHPGRADKKK